MLLYPRCVVTTWFPFAWPLCVVWAVGSSSFCVGNTYLQTVPAASQAQHIACSALAQAACNANSNCLWVGTSPGESHAGQSGVGRGAVTGAARQRTRPLAVAARRCCRVNHRLCSLRPSVFPPWAWLMSWSWMYVPPGGAVRPPAWLYACSSCVYGHVSIGCAWLDEHVQRGGVVDRDGTFHVDGHVCRTIERVL